MSSSSVKFLLLTVSFLEGGTLMAFEILSSKLYTPFLGSSLYVWTAILTITLIGLAVGYRIGGNHADKDAGKKLKLALGIAAVTVGVSSMISAPILGSMLGIDVKTAALMGGMLILFLPVMAMGMVSPLIVGLLHKEGTPVPVASGLVYGIGTFGGILLLLLTTFVLIPEIGVKNGTFLLSGLLIGALILVFMIKSGRNAQ